MYLFDSQYNILIFNLLSNFFYNALRVDAIRIYERLANKGKADATAYLKLARSYYFNAQYTDAGKWYEKLFTEYATEPIDSEDYYRYAETLKSMQVQVEVSRNVSEGVESISGHSYQSADTAAQTAEISRQLVKMAHHLSTLVNRFRL